MSLNNNNNKKTMAILKQIIFALFLRKFPNEFMADRSYERGTIFLQLALALRNVPS